MIWNTTQGSLDLSTKAQVMGILNTTPDSFSDGGHFASIENALAHARKMIAAGAAIIDVGGESTRPGAAPVTAEEETRRTIPVIQALRQEWSGLISIDTQKASVAEAALKAGADIVNDVSGLMADPQITEVCRKSRCGIVIMHMQGNPQTMQAAPTYSDVVLEIQRFFQERLETLTGLGISKNRLCFDPGIGFGKDLSHNLALLKNLEKLSPSHRPLLLGISRKSFLGKISENPDPTDRDTATAALTALARQKGIMLHRVHDVIGNLTALRATEALLASDTKSTAILD